MKSRLSWIAAILFFGLAVSCFAIEYYIDEEIVLDNDGTAYITGTTNLDILASVKAENEQISGSTDELTSKKASYWLFAYKSDANISNYLIKLALPEKVEINHIGSKSQVLITTEKKRQILTFIGENQPLDIKAQYCFKKLQKQEGYGIWLTALEIIMAIFLVFAVFTLIRKKAKKHKKSKKELDEEKLNTIKLTLNDSQLKIIEALVEKNGEASQTQLKHLVNLPKSSLSRNLELMAQKSVISKFYSGTSNYIKLHPSLYKQ